jgi:hypothetical protein
VILNQKLCSCSGHVAGIQDNRAGYNGALYTTIDSFIY